MDAMKPSILLSLFLALIAAIGVRPRFAQSARVALLIGNAAYPDAEAPLKQPISDAKALADELRRLGYEVETGDNLSKEAMQRALERFYGKIKPGSTALIFFSGYGIQS